MTLRSLLMTALALAALAAPASAQTRAAGRAVLSVTDVLQVDALEVVSTAAAGRVVRLDVVANQGWQLEAVLEDGAGRSWSAGRVAAGSRGRIPVELSYRALLQTSGAPAGATPRFTLSPL